MYLSSRRGSLNTWLVGVAPVIQRATTLLRKLAWLLIGLIWRAIKLLTKLAWIATRLIFWLLIVMISGMIGNHSDEIIQWIIKVILSR